MLRGKDARYEMVRGRSGFTLIEMLIVIIVLGILAMIIVPQITISTDDAKVSTLQSNVAGIRSAIEIYYVQHSNTYPGEKKNDGTPSPNATESATAFVEQLTRYTTASGSVANTKDSTAKYGPYIKIGQLPTNPFDDGYDVQADLTTNITTPRTADGATAYMIFPNVGIVFANDNGVSGGVNHSTY